jgi:DNA-binding transcriptional LysR family regulator
MERLEVLRKLQGGAGVLQAAGGSKSRQGLFSRQLRELEDACGMTLVDRRNRRIQLNQKGEALVQRYEQLLEELGLTDTKEDNEPCIRIGGGEVALVEGLIPLLGNYFDRIKITLQFRNLRSTDAIRLFRRGELDMVLSTEAPKPREGERYRLLLEEGYIIVADSKADQLKGIFLKTLLKEKLVLLEGKTPIRTFLENEADRLRVKLKLGALCSTYGQILNLVEKGGFVGVIPSICSAVAREKGLSLRRLISNKPPPYQFWLLYRVADPAGKDDLAMVLKALGEEVS